MKIWHIVCYSLNFVLHHKVDKLQNHNCNMNNLPRPLFWSCLELPASLYLFYTFRSNTLLFMDTSMKNQNVQIPPHLKLYSILRIYPLCVHFSPYSQSLYLIPTNIVLLKSKRKWSCEFMDSAIETEYRNKHLPKKKTIQQFSWYCPLK